MMSRWAVPAGWSFATTLLCVTLALLPMPAASQLADTWKKILATEDEGDIGRQLNKILSKADGVSSGRILVQVPGMPDEPFVELVTDVFEASVGRFTVGMSIDAIARETCGHVSRAYVRKLAAANTGSIVDGKVTKGKAGTEADITLPACLNARATLVHRIDKGDSVASISKSISGREFEAEYCETLKSLNTFDVCRASQTGRLQVGQQIRVPKSADSQLATPAFAVLKPSKDPAAVARLEQELPKALLTAARGEIGLGMTAPMDGPGVVVVPDAVPTSIVPTTTCATSKPPFDPAALVKAIEQFRVQAAKRNIPFASEVVIGVVDTGLHEKSRAMLLKFPPASSSGGAATVTPRQSSLIAGTAEGTFERSFFPTNSPDILPDAGPFADHGTHVTGLVIGGADLWTYLTTNAFEDARTPEYFASYVPRIVPVKVMSARSGGNPQTGTGEIISAIAYLVQKKAQIVNVSYVARYDVGLDRTFLGLRADNATLIVAAAGNDFESAGSLDDLLEETRKLPAMMSGDDVPMFITVGALDESGQGRPASFSQRGHNYVDLFAPGTCVRSFGAGAPLKEDIAYSGTSQAAPLVSFAAAILQRFGVPLHRIKERLMDTVDASDDLADISISGGALNLPKALNYLDDIVVFRAEPTAFRKGTIVHLRGEQEMLPTFVENICTNPQRQVLLRNARRIVVRDADTASWVQKQIAKFEYRNCKPNPNARFRLKSTDGGENRDFGLAEVREIIPRPHWLNRSAANP